jgi:LPXTG-site transpeptidase (sortase) family protein
MMPTGTEGDSPADESVPGDSSASFLRAVQALMGDQAATDQQPSRPAEAPAGGRQRRTDKATRRHEDKLAKAERKAARKRRRRKAAPPPEVATAAPVVARTDAPVEPQRVPAQAVEPMLEGTSDAALEVAAVHAQVATSRRARRRQRRQEAALAAHRPEPADEPALEAAVVEGATDTAPVRRSGTTRRGGRGSGAAPSGTGAGADTGSADPSGPSVTHDPADGVRDQFPQDLATPTDQDDVPQTVAEPRDPRRFRRTLRIAAVVLVIAGAVALPWADPRLPDAISGILPGHDSPVQVKDPPVSAPTDAVVGPIGVEQQAGPYDGVRLESAGWPREVVVKRLHVDSDVVPISGQSGSLLPPSDPQLLGWWKEGRPVGSEYGTAVVTGHTVHTGGGALDHLDQLVVGDTVRVRTDDGWIQYAVRRTQTYSTDQLARDAEQIFRQGGAGRLVLITCDDWNGSFYESNAVVFATPVLDEPFDS